MSDRSRFDITARLRQWIGPLMAAVVIGLVAILAYRIVNEYRWSDIARAIAAISSERIARGAIFAAASYFCLTWFDWLALRCIDRPLAYRQAALTSFCSLSIGHNVGFAGLSSGAVRYRFYARWGLGFEDVAKLVIFCGITVAMGLATVAGASLVLNPAFVASFAAMNPSVARMAGLMLLMLPAAYIGLTRLRKTLSLFGRSVRLPSTRLAAAQVGVGGLNYLCVSACLHQLLGSTGAVAYVDVAAAYVLANTGVIASHVPGGLGVLEGIVLSLLPGASVLAALLLFRVVYYLVPLAFGLTLLGLSEIALKPRQDWPARSAANASLQKR
jgi:glycosyltransferase 2 family protein